MPATLAIWLSDTAWIQTVTEFVSGPEFRPVRDSVGESISGAIVLAVATCWARFADHGTGRNAAVAQGTLARILKCSVRTIRRAWKVLAAAGLAVEAATGTGGGHPAANRASVWHLVSRPAAVSTAGTTTPAVPVVADPEAAPVEFVRLPPKAGLGCLTPVREFSPSVRASRARGENSSQDRRRQRRRSAPRPLAVQRLAAGLVTPVTTGPPDTRVGDRSAVIHGLDRVHIGAIGAAIESAGLDAEAWTPRALAAALAADMQATGWHWPDRLGRPGAFLASRLRRLPARPVTGPVRDDIAASGGAGPEAGGGLAEAVETTSAPAPAAPPTPRQRARIASAKEQIAALWTRDRKPATPPPSRLRPVAITAITATATGDCAGCGVPDAPGRPHMPATRRHWCEDCWR